MSNTKATGPRGPFVSDPTSCDLTQEEIEAIMDQIHLESLIAEAHEWEANTQQERCYATECAEVGYFGCEECTARKRGM